MMKKSIRLIAILMALVLLCMAGCGKDEKNSEKDVTGSHVSEAINAEEEPSKVNETNMVEAEAEESETEEETDAEDVTEKDAPVQEAFVPKGRVEMEMAQLPKQWSVKELGAAANGEGTLTFRSDDLFVRIDRDADSNVTYYAIDHMGNTISDQKFSDIEELLPGVFLVRAIAEGINNTGIMLENGEILLDCEAAIISRMYGSYGDSSERFLVVVYGTEETENKDEAFFYATKSMYSLSPKEGDTFYIGYAKVYDLENRAFIPDLTITNADKYASKAGGGCFSYTDEDNKVTVYNGKGEILYSGDRYASVELGNGFFLAEYQTVVDDQGEVLFKSDDYLHVLSGSGQFLAQSGYGIETTVYDYFGNKLFSLPEGTTVNADGGGLFCGSIGEDGALFDIQGNVVIQVPNISRPSYEGYGIWYFYSFKEDVKSVYYLANGTLVQPDKKSAYKLVNEMNDPPEKSTGIFPWNAPEEAVILPCSYVSALTNALVQGSSSEAMLVDCFSGSTLLTGKSIEFANDHYIYVKTDSGLTVYELTLEY